MAKEKFNMGNLLPSKPTVIKTGAPETAPLMEKAVETIHQAPPAGEAKQGPTRKISCDLPADWYKFIKRYCVDQDITMREYLLALIEEDLQKRQPA